MSRLPCRVVASVALLVCSITAIAQSSSPNDGSTPLALAPGAPAGSYSLSGFENISPFSGGLNFRLPLSTAGGRGQAGYTITQKIERKWTVYRFVDSFGDTYYQPQPNQWNGIQPGFGAGVMQGRYGGSNTTMTCNRGSGVIDKLYVRSLTRLTFIAPDGSEFELRDKLTDGAPANVPVCATSGFPRGKVFVSADGAAATFISDDVITDKYKVDDYGPFSVSGYLMLADGTRYRVLNGFVQWIRDNNGNKTTFTYSSGLTKITDSLNREITPGAGITLKGAGGASRSIQISTASLGTILRSGYSLQTYAALFPELSGSSQTQYNPTLTSAITLPNGKQYKFFYNSYAELTRVELPTGGAIEYDWAAGITNSNASGAVWLGPVLGVVDNWQIYRRVVERRVYPNGGTGSSYERKTTISRPETIDTSGNVLTDGYVIIDQTNATGNLLNREKHYYFGSAGASLKSHAGDTYQSWKDGKEYKTEIFDTNGATILRRVEHTWEQPVAGSTWPLTQPETLGVKPNNPHITQTVTTLEPSGTNLVTKQTFSYDKYSNRTDVYEYAFGSGAAGALVRRINTTYVTTNTVGGTTYDYACDPATNCSSSATLANVIHLRNLPKQVSVYDASGVERSRSTTEFDNYAADTTHAALTDRSGISGFDSSFTTAYVSRGNVTASSRYLLNIAGQVTGSISSYLQYDIAGNVVKTIDARGCASSFDFTDRFGSPDADARLNSAPLELSSQGQASYAFPTQVTNCLNHTSYTQFDYYVNRPVDAEDANGVVSSSYSENDPLDRPTKVILAANKDASVKAQTVFSYDDTARTVTTAIDQTTFGDGLLVSATVYDGLGRTTQTRQYEGGTNFIAVQTQYDGLGRPYQTSSPFRPWKPGEAPEFTTTLFDGLGRVKSVTTPDTAVVSTSYSGNTVTVIDQAGKARKSVMDALGRLTDVYEDPNDGNPNRLNYQTSYQYDTLDNLVRVAQDTQQRFFMYDSLKRLIRVDNPEQETLSTLDLSDPVSNHGNWTAKYEYDNNGNLTSKTDARGVVTETRYDTLNRLDTVLYRINGQPDPNTGDIQYVYDNATYGKGRLWLTYRWGAKPSHTTVGEYDALGRVKQLWNDFSDGQGGWLPGYEIYRNYNLAGQVKYQRYPSGHTVDYSYDPAGRTTTFTGNLGDGVTRTYASSFLYNARSQVTQELFGTGIPLYHKLQYNVRGQLWDVRVSTNPDVNGSSNRGGLQFFYEQNLGYGTSGPDNNGNVLFANTYVLTDDPNVWAINRQKYDYDSLNRLNWVKESFVSDSQAESPQSAQTYDYDRWGNRTIITAQTWGTGINNTAFEVESARNRLYSPGDLAPNLPEENKRIRYDKAGNQIKDTYVGSSTATYDGDNHIVAINGGSSTYTYNANGQRVRRKINNQETWQIYGIDGELVAEYAANAPVATPQKEYGYRDGQLLVTAESSAPVAAGSPYGGNAAAIPGVIQSENFDNGGEGVAYHDTTPGTHGQDYDQPPSYPPPSFRQPTDVDIYKSTGYSNGYLVLGQAGDWTSYSVNVSTTGTYTLQAQVAWGGTNGSPGSFHVEVDGVNKTGSMQIPDTGWVFTTVTKAGVQLTAGTHLLRIVWDVNAANGLSGDIDYLNFTLTAAASPYGGTAAAIPGVIQSENFDNGGEGVAYHDTTPGTHGQDYDQPPSNPAPSFRQPTDVDIYKYTGYSNGYLVLGQAGDWTSYSVNVSTSGTYTLQAQVAWGGTNGSPGSFHVEVDGVDKTGSMQIPDTGWAFTTVTKAGVQLTAGTHLLRIVWDVNASNGLSGNIDYLNFTLTAAVSGSGSIHWLVPDHLGTPRIILDQTGSSTNVRRHDYLPFGEELPANTGGRAPWMGYAGDGVRQQFTRKERDFETDLDYFLARYYSSKQGRFTSPDEFRNGNGESEKRVLSYADRSDPQSLNKYQYSFNNPLRYVDQDGHRPQDPQALDWDVKDLVEGRITENEFRDRQVARGMGGVVGAVIVALRYSGPAAAIAILRWASQNPQKVEQLTEEAIQASSGNPTSPSRGAAAAEAGVVREGLVAGLTGGRVSREVVTVKGLGSTDIDVIGKAGEYIAVGGPAKTADQVGRQLQILKAAADEKGVKTMAYFAKGTSEAVLKVARKWLGKDNVKIFEEVK